jgi:hypothetical protein
VGRRVDDGRVCGASEFCPLSMLSVSGDAPNPLRCREEMWESGLTELPRIGHAVNVVDPVVANLECDHCR